MMLNQLSYLFLAIKDFVAPLKGYFDSLESMEYLFYRYGWNLTLDDELFGKINQGLGIKDQLQQCIDQATALKQKLDTDPNATLGPDDIAALASSAQKLFSALAAFSVSDFSTLAAPLNNAEFWSDVSEQLLDDLQETYLRIYYPKAYAFLHLFGIIRYEVTIESVVGRIDYTRTVVDWEQAVEIIKSPQEAFKKTYHWNDPQTPFDHEALLSALEKVLRVLGLSARLAAPGQNMIKGIPSGNSFNIQSKADSLLLLFFYRMSPVDKTVYEIGLRASPAVKNGQTDASGLLLSPVLRGGTGVDIPIGRDFKLQWSGSIDAGSLFGAAVFPDGVNTITGQPAIATGLTFTRSNTSNPWYLIGNSKTTRIELSTVAIGLSMDGTATDPEIKFHFKIGDPGSGNGVKVVIPLEESDSLVKTSTGKNDIEFSFEAEIIWSSKSGLQFNGGAGLDIQLPVSIQMGLVTLQNAHVALVAGKKTTSVQGVELQLTAGLQGKFGPVSFEIDGLGLGANVIPYSKQDLQAIPAGSKPPLFGKFDLDLSFVPPKGIGIAIDAAAVSGGGYLFFDPDKGEYAGVAQLTIQNKIIVKAIGIIQTKLPEGKPGYSFLLIISAEFPGIQLGMGFSLTGVGGLVGINRGMDLTKLAAGIYDNSINDVLFPPDPLKNAYALINAINGFFPATSGQYTIGLMAQLAWGPANLVTIELGLIIEFPEPVRIAIIGIIHAIVKKKSFGKEIIALQLQVNFLASIDFDRKYIKMDASLYQSKLISMELTGDMALRVKYGSNADFAITIGGFFPGFQPPALELPAKITMLQIILNSGNPYIAVGCYLAVTSNTVQFGISGIFKLSKWGVAILGTISFDALFQISPFHFEVDIHVFLGASWHGYDFAHIKVDGTFSGPSPWHVTGSMELSVWIFSKTVQIDEYWGEDDDSAMEKISVLPLLAQDLAAMANWERTTGSTGTLVTIRTDPKKEPDPDLLILHPNELIAVRQNTVPLGISIDKFGTRQPQGANKFNVVLKDKNNADLPSSKLQNRFAPAQFIDMTDDQKLNAPSYQLFDAGINFDGLDAVAFDDFVAIPVVYETRTIDDPSLTPQPPVSVTEINTSFIHGLLNGSLSNSAFGQLPRLKSAAAQTIREQFVVVDAVSMKKSDGTAVATNSIQAMQLLNNIKQTDFYNRLNLAVLPAEEALA